MGRNGPLQSEESVLMDLQADLLAGFEGVRTSMAELSEVVRSELRLHQQALERLHKAFDCVLDADGPSRDPLRRGGIKQRAPLLQVDGCATEATHDSSGQHPITPEASRQTDVTFEERTKRRRVSRNINQDWNSEYSGSLTGGVQKTRFTRLRVRTLLFLRVHGWWIDFLTGIMIACSAVTVGVEIQNSLDGVEWVALSSLEHVFLVFFVMELCLRMLANANNYLRSGWFLLEAVLVVAGIAGTWIVEPIVKANISSDVTMKALENIMILRILRVLRLVRALRLLEFFAELWKLVSGVLSSAKTVIYACFLIFMTIYIFACMGVEAIVSSEALRANPDTNDIVQSRFCGVLRMMLTLVAFTNADSISAIYEPIISENPYLTPFFLLVWLFVTVSLMNLVTAVIVDTAISQSSADEEQKRQVLRRMAKKLVPEIEQLFHDLDRTGDGSLEVKELDFNNISLPPSLASFIDEEKLKDLFQFLDLDGSGQVDQEEFTDGIMHLTLQTVPIETTQTLQLLRSQQKSIADIQEGLRDLRRAFAEEAFVSMPRRQIVGL